MATVSVIIDPRAAFLATTAMPEFVLITGTNAPVTGYAFDDTTREDIYFSLPLLSYGSGNMTLVVRWYSRAGSTTGGVVWGTRIACITPTDNVSVEAKNWTTAQTQATTVRSTAKYPNTTSVAISNLDSAAALDEMWLDVYRLPTDGSDTMTGDAIITSMYLTYSDT
jgi:hypothetical protein